MPVVFNRTRNVNVAEYVDRATKLSERLRGLLGRKNFPHGHGLWIDSCNSIHTFFMHFPIDVVFLNQDGKVLRTYENLKPYRLTRLVWGASSVLELPAGTIKSSLVKKGDLLGWKEKR